VNRRIFTWESGGTVWWKSFAWSGPQPKKGNSALPAENDLAITENYSLSKVFDKMLNAGRR
jgi:hypothetical protein